MTDDAIERARRDLGPGRPDAWLCLRVYDVTDRIFDGTNAHSVDWPFIMRTGTTVSYATGRLSEHILRFTRLYEEVKQGRVTESRLADVEARDNVFPDLDYRLGMDRAYVAGDRRHDASRPAASEKFGPAWASRILCQTSVAEIEVALRGAEGKIEADARKRIHTLHNEARRQLVILRGHQREATRLLWRLSTAADGSWDDLMIGWPMRVFGVRPYSPLPGASTSPPVFNLGRSGPAGAEAIADLTRLAAPGERDRG